MFARFLKRRHKGNQRFRTRPQEHRLPLEVPRSRKEVFMRRRKLALQTLKWTGLVTAVLWVGLTAGGLWQRAFRNSGDFAVGQFELVTNGVITVPQVAAATGLRPDQNITELDLGELRAKLMELPRVSRADVERRLPNHLSIRLDERRPAAWLACARQNLRAFDSRGLLLDSEGVAFPCGIVLEEYGTLPVINCADVSAVTPGRRVPLAMVRNALDLALRMHRKTWATPMAVEQIHIINDFTMVAQMDTDALFTFLPTDLDRQLARLNAILQKTGAAGRRVASVNLQLHRNVPVTFKEESVAPLARPAAGKAPGAAGKRPSPSSPPAAAAEDEIHSILRGA